MIQPVIFHDLQCRSGFGDRLLDTWAAATISYLLNPFKPMALRWHSGLQFAAFIGDYATDAFSIPHCEFVSASPTDVLAVNKTFSHDEFNQGCLYQLSGGVYQLILRTGRIWGNSYPDCLYSDRGYYGLSADLTLEKIVNVFRAIAGGTISTPELLYSAPLDIGQRIGVHIRRSDKTVNYETSTDMSPHTWKIIEQYALEYLEHCVSMKIPLHICSEDMTYRDDLISYLRAKGGDVTSLDCQLHSGGMTGAPAMIDFFALSRCSQIVQMTKYSTFSLAASLVGRVRLINFFDNQSGTGSRLDLWKNTLYQ